MAVRSPFRSGLRVSTNVVSTCPFAYLDCYASGYPPLPAAQARDSLLHASKGNQVSSNPDCGGTLASSTYFPQDAIFVTPHGRSFHIRACPHVQRSSKRYDPCKDCFKRRD